MVSVHHHRNLSYSNLFVVEKKGGGQRLVINLSSLNSFVRHHHFKMEDLKVVADILRPQDFMCKIDLKDTYFAVPIHPEHQKLLCFQFQNVIYQFKCMPTLRPHISTSGLHKTAEAPGGFCEEIGSTGMHLHRRHANPEFLEGGSSERCLSDDPPAGKSGVYCEQGKIYL